MASKLKLSSQLYVCALASHYHVKGLTYRLHSIHLLWKPPSSLEQFIL